MRVCFLLPSISPSGGVNAVLQHARWLTSDSGHDVTIVLTETSPDARAPELAGGAEVTTIEQLDDRPFDVAVATWWKTAYHLFEVPARRYAYFVQSLEDRFYPTRTIPRASARITIGLPVCFITEAEWIADVLRQARPDTSCHLVANGIDKQQFAPLDELPVPGEDPLRILIEGHPDVWFKAVGEARQSVAAMSQPNETVFVVPNSAAFGETLEFGLAEGPLDTAQLAARYQWADVVLKLSRVEGMFGPPLEGFHKGATCVVSPVTGHDQYIEHGWNGIVTDWDDTHGTARWLDLLSLNRPYLHFLQRNALSTARSWPSWKQSANSMALALEEIARSEPPTNVSLNEILRSVESALAPVERYMGALGLSHGGLPEQPRTWKTRLNALVERRGMRPLRFARDVFILLRTARRGRRRGDGD